MESCCQLWHQVTIPEKEYFMRIFSVFSLIAVLVLSACGGAQGPAIPTPSWAPCNATFTAAFSVNDDGKQLDLASLGTITVPLIPVPSSFDPDHFFVWGPTNDQFAVWNEKNALDIEAEGKRFETALGLKKYDIGVGPSQGYQTLEFNGGLIDELSTMSVCPEFGTMSLAYYLQYGSNNQAITMSQTDVYNGTVVFEVKKGESMLQFRIPLDLFQAILQDAVTANNVTIANIPSADFDFSGTLTDQMQGGHQQTVAVYSIDPADLSAQAMLFDIMKHAAAFQKTSVTFDQVNTLGPDGRLVGALLSK